MARKKDQNKQIYWILGVMILVLVIILLIPAASRWFNSFNYEGLSFTKERFGTIPVYHYYYNLKDVSGKVVQYNLFLRIDPRTNNATVKGDILYHPKASTVYVTFNQTDILTCPNVLREASTLTSFLADNQYKVKTGISDESEAIANNVTFITCEKYPSDMVISISKSNQTSIEKKLANCYNIKVADCAGLLEAVEKFEVQSIIDAKNAASN